MASECWRGILAVGCGGAKENTTIVFTFESPETRPGHVPSRRCLTSLSAPGRPGTDHLWNLGCKHESCFGFLEG